MVVSFGFLGNYFRACSILLYKSAIKETAEVKQLILPECNPEIEKP